MKNTLELKIISVDNGFIVHHDYHDGFNKENEKLVFSDEIDLLEFLNEQYKEEE